MTWLAAGLEGLDDEHAAAAAEARVRERAVPDRERVFSYSQGSKRSRRGPDLQTLTFSNIPPRDGFRPVTRPSAQQSRSSQLADRCLELSSEGHRRLFPERQPRCRNWCPERHPDPRTLHEVRDPHVIRTLIEGRNKWNAGVKRDHGGTALKRNILISGRSTGFRHSSAGRGRS
jgi:hypothetical protein